MALKIYMNELGHMTKVVSMPMDDENIKNLKQFLSRTNRPIVLKRVMYNRVLEYYQECLNNDLRLILPFLLRSNIGEC